MARCPRCGRLLCDHLVPLPNIRADVDGGANRRTLGSQYAEDLAVEVARGETARASKEVR